MTQKAAATFLILAGTAMADQQASGNLPLIVGATVAGLVIGFVSCGVYQMGGLRPTGQLLHLWWQQYCLGNAQNQAENSVSNSEAVVEAHEMKTPVAKTKTLDHEAKTPNPINSVASLTC